MNPETQKGMILRGWKSTQLPWSQIAKDLSQNGSSQAMGKPDIVLQEREEIVWKAVKHLDSFNRV